MRLTPGHPALALPPAPGHDIKRVLLFDGESPREAGICSEDLALDDGAKRPTMRRVQMLRFEPIGELAGISSFDPASLAPFTHQTRQASLQIEATYTEAGVTGGTAREGGGVKPFRIPPLATAFDLYGVEVALRVLALAADFDAELELFWPERAGYFVSRLTVIGNEPTEAGHGRVEPAWIVRFTLDDVTSDYRIGAESRELLAQTQRLVDGTRLDFVR